MSNERTEQTDQTGQAESSRENDPKMTPEELEESYDEMNMIPLNGRLRYFPRVQNDRF